MTRSSRRVASCAACSAASCDCNPRTAALSPKSQANIAPPYQDDDELLDALDVDEELALDVLRLDVLELEGELLLDDAELVDDELAELVDELLALDVLDELALDSDVPDDKLLVFDELGLDVLDELDKLLVLDKLDVLDELSSSMPRIRTSPLGKLA
jgi:hypothetical protein